MTVVTSPTLLFIPESELIVDYVLSFAALAFVLVSWYLIYRRAGITLGMALSYFRSDWRGFLSRVFVYGFFHRKNVKNRYAGTMHVLISYGILILFIATALIFLSHDIVKPVAHHGILNGGFYLNFEFWANLGGVMLLAGTLMGLVRRGRGKVMLETTEQDYIILLALLALDLEGFFLGALKIYAFREGFDVFRFVEYPLSYVYSGLPYTTAIVLYRSLWMAHVLTAFALAVYLPFSKLSHMVMSLILIGAKRPRVRGAMTTPFLLTELMASGNFDISIGVKKISELPKLKKAEALACTNCGRCERACPAVMSGTDLTPRLVVQNIKANYTSDGEMTQVVLSENATWSCTTCQACVEECPVLIDPHSFIMETRRNLVMENRTGKDMQAYFNNLTNTRNPFGNPPSDRDAMLQFAPKFDGSQEVLYWVGCMGAFDPRDNKTARAIIELLKKAGVSFGILGSEEACTGETARRMGEEGRFQELALQNIDTFNRYGVKKIVTACPHCYNTFRNEYPELGLKAEVYHHSQFLSSLIESGRLKVKNSEVVTTYHDPCYLGRINREFEKPRNIVQSTSRLVEMERSRERSMCCGAGGGNYWYKVQSQRKISQIRLEQAMSTGAKRLAVACPFCMPMLEDAVRTSNSEGRIEVKDIAELILENLAD